MDEQKTRFFALEKWFCSEHGLKIAKAFAAELAPIQDLLHGDTLLQLGRCADNPFFRKSRFQHQWVVAPFLKEGLTLVSQFNQLPVDRDSVDCIIAPLTIDAFTVENNPLDEIDRILKPFGYAIFFGINPFSLWGGWLRYGNNTCFGDLPTKPKSVFSIQRAMMHRGYIQCHLVNFYYVPPLSNKKLIEKFDILNQVGKMISPVPAGFYCLVVQKQQENLIPLIPFMSNEKYNDVPVSPLQPTFRE